MILLVAALVLDLVLGDPQYPWHPIRGIGWVIDRFDRLLGPGKGESPRSALLSGGLLFVVVQLSVYTVYHLGVYMFHMTGSSLLLFGFRLYLLYSLLAIRSLVQETSKVIGPLAQGDLQGARQALSYLVSRETEDMEAEKIVTSTVETLSENFVDGTLSPLLAYAIGGLPAVLFVKVASTLDSMVGYKTERYLYFGRVSARMDDLVHYLPARIAPLLVYLASWLMGGHHERVFKVVRRDAKKHQSPNSGYPEAAFAASLGIQVGGPTRYFGSLLLKPTFGDPTHAPVVGDLVRCHRLYWLVSIQAMVMTLALTYLLKGGV